jgi:hypothetical protein
MYLLLAHYRNKRLNIDILDKQDKGKNLIKLKGVLNIELERCLDDNDCPIDNITKANLKFLIGLRHEIEHQMTTKIDEYLSARFQACCLNYNDFIKQLFGD